VGWKLAALLLLPACKVAYVARSAYFQAELMAQREPIDRVLARGELNPTDAELLALVPAIKAFGESQGLSNSRSYESISTRWDRTIYNFSACPPLSFDPVTWWFPVVGRVPYLGFFRERDSDRYRERYEQRGYEVWVRTAGAYSTLGWFRDPILPGMLAWEEHRLSETVLHELAHATLWVKGSVDFNESYANVVGKEAALRWMVERYGASSEQVSHVHRRREDIQRWRALLQELYNDLDVVYKFDDKSEREKLTMKQELLASLESRVISAGFHDRQRYLAAVDAGPWNNARLRQFRTYNDGQEAFHWLLQRHNGDLRLFIEDLDRITTGTREPWTALRQEVAGSQQVQK